jgi:hypothetical protein
LKLDYKYGNNLNESALIGKTIDLSSIEFAGSQTELQLDLILNHRENLGFLEKEIVREREKTKEESLSCLDREEESGGFSGVEMEGRHV